jgi:ubiquinone/menaquinone biosynthesis C-methylase UbiE
MAGDLAKKLRLLKNESLLEVGCGNALLLSELKQYVRDVTGVDFSYAMISRAKQALEGERFCVAEAGGLPFADEAFDKVLCYGACHYFPDIKYVIRAMKEFIRVCKKGGIILVGDVPSKKHRHLYHYFKLKRERSLKDRFLSVVRALLRRKRPVLVRTPEKWTWYDLEWLTSFIKSLGLRINILEQPLNRQYGEITYTHRFDVLIEK